MLTIWFIRHAESESNAGLPTSDPATIALTARGYEQAEYIAASFRETPTLIVTSPYIRTKQTAQPTIRRFADVPQEEWPIQEFTYLSLEHRLHTTPNERKPLLEAYWERCDPCYSDGAGAESFADLIDRVQHTLERINRLEQGFVAVFSHGLFARAVLWSLLAGPDELTPIRMRRFRMFATSLKMPNASILRMRFNDTKDDVWFSTFGTAHLPAHLVTL
jgi:probable phosphoglycerate mutase